MMAVQRDAKKALMTGNSMAELKVVKSELITAGMMAAWKVHLKVPCSAAQSVGELETMSAVEKVYRLAHY